MMESVRKLAQTFYPEAEAVTCCNQAISLSENWRPESVSAMAIYQQLTEQAYNAAAS